MFTGEMVIAGGVKKEDGILRNHRNFSLMMV